jgi:hypothetical protein
MCGTDPIRLPFERIHATSARRQIAGSGERADLSRPLPNGPDKIPDLVRANEPANLPAVSGSGGRLTAAQI